MEEALRTGHVRAFSRRTGALRYIRHGWATTQVARLGRWKSAVIYVYAAEALESLPVNIKRAFMSDLCGKKDGDQSRCAGASSDRRLDEVRDYLLAENCSDIGSRIIHVNWDMTSCIPPPKHGGIWRTLCGWHYHKSDYVFSTKDQGGVRAV